MNKCGTTKGRIGAKLYHALSLASVPTSGELEDKKIIPSKENHFDGVLSGVQIYIT